MMIAKVWDLNLYKVVGKNENVDFIAVYWNKIIKLNARIRYEQLIGNLVKKNSAVSLLSNKPSNDDGTSKRKTQKFDYLNS